MSLKQKIIITNLIIANCAILVFPYLISGIAIIGALIIFQQFRQQIFLWLLISTSLISLVLGTLLHPITISWIPLQYSINLENLKFALVIIPVPFIVNLLFISSFFEQYTHQA